MNTKICTQCKIEQTTNEFSPDKRLKDGLRRQCKTCARKDAKRYREENPDIVRASKRAWVNNNKEIVANINARHKQKFKARYLDYQKKYYTEHLEERRAYSRQWAKRNPTKRLENQRRREARKLTNWVEDVNYLTVFERDNWICQICFIAVDPDVCYSDLQCASLDHILPIACGGEHSYANVQLAHLHCNIKKWKVLL